MKKNFVLAITGASGALYAVRLLEVLLAAGRTVYLSISPSGQAVLKEELSLTVDLERFHPECLSVEGTKPGDNLLLDSIRGRSAGTSKGSAGGPSDGRSEPGKIRYCHYQDLMAPIASGSFVTGGMVICPCSGSTLAATAHALGTNLIHRAAEVHLKERRKLIVVPREAPLSLPQLDNMRRLTEAGAVVLPASPGFYHGVRSIGDLIDFVVGRICDQLEIEHTLMRRWGEQ